MNTIRLFKAYETLDLTERFQLLDFIILDLSQYSDSLEFNLDFEAIKESLSTTTIETIMKVGSEQ